MVAPAATRIAGEMTFQRLMPPAKQTTISCSMCSRFSAITAATNTATGRITLISWGRARRVALRKTRMLWRWSTIRSRALRLWLRKATTVRAARANRVGTRIWRNR